MDVTTRADEVAAEIRHHVEALFDAFSPRTVRLSEKGESKTEWVSRLPVRR